VVIGSAGVVERVNIAQRKVTAHIKVGSDPVAIALRPDGSEAYVADAGSNEVTPVLTRTARPLPPIHVGAGPNAIAVLHDGKTAVVLDHTDGAVQSIGLATNTVGAEIFVAGATSLAPGFIPSTVVVASSGSGGGSTLGKLYRVNVSTRAFAVVVALPSPPVDVAAVPGSTIAYVLVSGENKLLEVDTLRRVILGQTPVGSAPTAVAVWGDVGGSTSSTAG
jgi:DNA-binding beta-propeller fold protein YncE